MRITFKLIPVAFLLFTVALVAQTAKPAAPAAPRPRAAAPRSTYKPTATVKDLMDYLVIPSSEALFNAVGTTTGPNGAEEHAPKTEADWAAVRQRAMLLIEAGNLLTIPGRHVAGAKD